MTVEEWDACAAEAIQIATANQDDTFLHHLLTAVDDEIAQQYEIRQKGA